MWVSSEDVLSWTLSLNHNSVTDLLYGYVTDVPTIVK